MNRKASPHDLTLKAASREKSEVAVTPLEFEPDLSLDLAEHKLSVELEALRQQLDEARDTHQLRLGYASRIFWLVVAWLACVAVAVFMSGFALWSFKLSDKVLITFITSTTINVVGLFVVVAKWMFPNGNSKKNS